MVVERTWAVVVRRTGPLGGRGKAAGGGQGNGADDELPEVAR